MYTPCLTAILALALLGGTASAQEGDSEAPRRPRAPIQQQQLTPDQAEQAWTIQAQGVAQRLELDGESTKKLLENYLEVRSTQHETRQQSDSEQRRRRAERDGGFGRSDRNARSREQLQEQRDAFKANISAYLTDDQTKKAMSSLGALSRQWDTMVHAVHGFGLDADASTKAYKSIEHYVSASTAMLQEGDRRAMRDAMTMMTEELHAQLGTVLNEEQLSTFSTFKSVTTQRRRGGGGNFAERLKEMDANGDGKIALDEVPERMQRMFDRFDSNGDGFIDEKEIEQVNNMGRQGNRRPGSGIS